MTGWTGADARTLAAFEAAARAFVGLVATIDGGWDDVGLGAWDLRSLVGHTSRSLVTVTTYLDVAAEREDLASAGDYVVASTAVAAADAEAVVGRGRQAGFDLGPDPAAAVAQRATDASAKLASADPDRLIRTLAGGMRVRTYLPTRTFELVVHGYDIADAVGLDADPGDLALGEANAVASQVAVRLGHGTDLLRGLTGRGPWPEGFVVVR